MDFVKEQAESIRVLGQLVPILVSPVEGDNYVIVDGHTTVEALRLLGKDTVDCNIRKLSEQEMMDVAWHRNCMRRDWSDYEKARFLDEYKRRFGLSQEQIAEKAGYKAHVQVSRLFAMVKAENDRVVPAGTLRMLNEGQFRALMQLPADIRKVELEKIEKTGLVPSMTGLEALSKQLESKPTPCDSCQSNEDNGGPEEAWIHVPEQDMVDISQIDGPAFRCQHTPRPECAKVSCNKS